STSTATPTPTSTSTPSPSPTPNGCTPNPNPPAGTPPSASIASPADGSQVTSPTSVRGSVNSATLQCWTLSYTRFGSSTSTTIGSGTTPVTNATLGTFDPTLLINGAYRINLTAIDTAGRSTVASVGVTAVQ